jgi:AraC-like DNA-binding protein
MSDRSGFQVCRSDLDRLMTALEVNFVKLAECLVSAAWRLSLPAVGMPGIHYVVMGCAKMTVGNEPAIPLAAHTLVIVPPAHPVRIDVAGHQDIGSMRGTVEPHWRSDEPPESLLRVIAGDDEAELILICGYFRASFGTAVDLFASLSSPIVEKFDPSDRLGHPLKLALAELVAQEVGAGAMTAALLKQVLVMLFRRSLSSADLWVERFSMLGDRRIARAFADMVARPAAPQSVENLAQVAGLSRSAFMARFTHTFGSSPMVVLRRLRMRHAASLLAGEGLSVDQIAQEAGYASRSSFVRAFRNTYGTDPSDYRAERHLSGPQLDGSE